MRDIKGYEHEYAVTEDGQVYSYKSKKFLKQNKNKQGYLRVQLCKNGKVKNYYVHRLVLETYKPVEGMENLQVNHKSEIKTENYLNNLEWMTAKENANYGTRNQHISISKGTAVRCLETKIVYSSAAEAERQTGFSHGNILACCRGERKAISGYHFMFEKDFQDMLVAELLEKTFLDNNN